MKKIQLTWKKYLKEASLKSNPDQSRLKVSKKMLDYLFSPLGIVDPRLDMSLRASGNIVSKYVFLYWAVFGTKQERMEKSKIYRPELGLALAKQKVDMLMLKLTDDEEKTLSADIDMLIDIVKSKAYPTNDIQIPVTLTGHPGVDPSFGTAFVSGYAASDWAMGGSMLTPDGKSYLLHIMELLKASLPPSDYEKLKKEEVLSLYFYGRPYVKPEKPKDPETQGHFSKKAFNYNDFLKSIGRGPK